MPLYEYKCDNCESIFEKIQSISNRNIPLSQPCPECKEIGYIISLMSSANFKINGYSEANGYSKQGKK